jgi:ferredoxin
MGESWLITAPRLDALFTALAKAGVYILAPHRMEGRVELAEVRSAADVCLDHVQTASSAKGLVFPRVEAVLGYRGAGRDVELLDQEPAVRPTVVFGIRPCEARAFRVLDVVFNWDTRDRFFDGRRQALTLVSIACTQADEACFCTSTGGAPDDPQGSDVLLRPLVGGGYVAEPVTASGEALLVLAGEPMPLPPGAHVATPAEVPAAFDSTCLARLLEREFESTAWAEQSLRCLGCGACAFVCPTCACFDLQDEPAPSGGRRLRCWDSCGLRQFTLHASGHNPREHQSQRWRQRVCHKFLYFPDRFGMIGCVGCGKCTRACPVDMGLKVHLVALAGASR